MVSDRMECREVVDVRDPLLPAAERLYQATQHPDEAIPWEWIVRSVGRRTSWQPGTRNRHLVLAIPETAADEPAVAGFAYGVHLPGYGGYVCYLGVDGLFRKQGVGTTLFAQMFQLMKEDAACAGEPLPFVIWESHQPGPAGSETEEKLWAARVRLFDRVGGLWLEGLELLTPNFGQPEAAPIPLQLFLRPIAEPASAFPTERLRAIVAGLLMGIYQVQPGHPLYDRTLAPQFRPRLRPARTAIEPEL
ncbi:MAG: GNAT family N-acetyltransferase [Bacteroidales bacterium]|nr:GNAT family N-acetyltransferase [Bacteroidales bacterium]